MKSIVFFVAALFITTVLSVPAQALIASDSASDPAYASGWAAGSNGGSGFGPWDFTRQAFYSGLGPAAWGNQTHFIDNAPVPFNNLGKPAFAISVDDCSYCGVYSSATRPFDSPLAVGQSFSMDFDNPLLASPDFNSQNNIIRFNDSAGNELFSVFGTNYFSGQEWNISGGASTGITDAATSVGSSIKITRTGSNTLNMILNGTLFPGLPIGGSGNIAEVTVNFGNTLASSGDGSREFFLNHLQIAVPEPASLMMAIMAGCGLVASVRRRK
jgi:hypothetical protein